MPGSSRHSGSLRQEKLGNCHVPIIPSHDLESGAPLEKDFSQTNGYHEHLGANHDSQAALHKIRTAGSISMSPDLFEKLYLSPQTAVKGDLRKTFGNPTPFGLVGFLFSLTPLSMDLMEWRGSSGTGAAGTGFYFFFGGLLMFSGAIGEWILGNTFPFVVFGTFGAFWLSFAATLTPFYNAYGAFSTDPALPAEGMATAGSRSAISFFFIAMTIMCVIFLICSLRTNIAFFMIFFPLVFAFPFLAAANFQLNDGNVGAAGRLQKAGGAFFFVACMAGWWSFIAIMLASLDFPFTVPVGDLSDFIKSGSERRKRQE